GHRDEAALRLVIAYQLQLRLGSGFREKIVYAGFRGNGGGREAIVAGDHDRLDAHAAQLGETLLDAALDDVLQLDGGEDARAVGHHQRRGAAPGDRVHGRLHLVRKAATQRLDVLADGVCGALPDLAALEIDAAHARVRGERDECGLQGSKIALPQV